LERSNQKEVETLTLLPFKFQHEKACTAAAVFATIPAGITSKKELLATLARQLHFPDYFGGNWDSLEECIRDLSWLPAGLVVLKHVDVPSINDIKNARIYLKVLAGAANKSADSKDHPLSVVFPIELREQTLWLLRSG
jgi:RNAse (barnase) inhibitor barstar